MIEQMASINNKIYRSISYLLANEENRLLFVYHIVF